MGKGLTLTLNDLIKLGVIKTKKRKAHKGHKIKYKIENSTASSTLRQPSDHMRGYATVNNLPPVMNPYTDNLRLRDANDSFNSRLLEYKNQLQDEKLKTDDFMSQSKNAYRYLLQNIPTTDRFGTDLPVERRLGYDLGDSVDVPDTSTGFESQIDHTAGGTSPYLIPGTPQYELSRKPSEVILEDDKGDPNAPIKAPRTETIIATPEGPKPISTLGRMLKNITGGASSDKSKKKIVIEEGENDYDAPTTPTKSVQFQNTKVGGGNIRGPTTRTLDPHTVETTKSKPTKLELQNWRKWYEDLGGHDDSVSAFPSRTKYQQEISKLLLDQYLAADGNDPNILKSRDPNLINTAIYKMLKEKYA